MNTSVASLHGLGGATVQHGPFDATEGATESAEVEQGPAMTAAELRAQLRVQRGRNAPATTCRGSAVVVASARALRTKGAESQIDYTLADLEEFDRLIRRYCDILGHSATKREDLLAARRWMRPASVSRGLAEFSQLVGELEEQC